MVRLSIVWLLLVLAAVTPLIGQQPRPAIPPTTPSAADPAEQQPSPLFRAGIELVRVDVSVRDGRDQAVEDLAPADFEIREDGIPQTVETVQFVHLDGVPSSDYQESLEIRSREHAAIQAARDDVRLFAIFLDDYHVDKNPQVMVPLRRALQDFVKQLGPMDLVAIMDPLTPLTHLKFTRSRAEMLERVRSFEGRRGELFPIRSVLEEAQLAVRHPWDIRAQVTLSALDALVTHLGGLREGRKSVLFVSQGPPVRLAGSTNELRVRDLLRNANRGNVTIHALDPSPFGTVPFGDDAVLRRLADETGGRAIVNTNTPGTHLTGVIADASAYYLVGYAPRRAVLSDGKFHKIDVKVKRRGARVVARRGYWAPSAADMTPSAATLPPVEVLEALVDLVEPVKGRDIDVWVGMSRGPGDSTRVSVTWDSKGRDDTSGPARLEIEPLDVDGGKPLADPQTIVTSDGTDATSAAAFDVTPGSITLRFTARDAKGAIVDRWPARVSVPALTGPLALATPRFLRARTAFELRRLDSGSGPAPAASRRFRATDRLMVDVECYSMGGEPVEVIAELLNQNGTLLLTLPVPALTAGKVRLPIPVSSLARSTYMLRLRAKMGKREVRQVAPFQIVP